MFSNILFSKILGDAFSRTMIPEKLLEEIWLLRQIFALLLAPRMTIPFWQFS